MESKYLRTGKSVRTMTKCNPGCFASGVFVFYLAEITVDITLQAQFCRNLCYCHSKKLFSHRNRGIGRITAFACTFGNNIPCRIIDSNIDTGRCTSCRRTSICECACQHSLPFRIACTSIICLRFCSCFCPGCPTLCDVNGFHDIASVIEVYHIDFLFYGLSMYRNNRNQQCSQNDCLW